MMKKQVTDLSLKDTSFEPNSNQAPLKALPDLKEASFDVVSPNKTLNPFLGQDIES